MIRPRRSWRAARQRCPFEGRTRSAAVPCTATAGVFPAPRRLAHPIRCYRPPRPSRRRRRRQPWLRGRLFRRHPLRPTHLQSRGAAAITREAGARRATTGADCPSSGARRATTGADCSSSGARRTRGASCRTRRRVACRSVPGLATVTPRPPSPAVPAPPSSELPGPFPPLHPEPTTRPTKQDKRPIFATRTDIRLTMRPIYRIRAGRPSRGREMTPSRSTRSTPA